MRKLNIRLDLVLVQAVIAGALSFAHLHDIAHAAGQHGWKAWAYPVSVDLLLVAAWRKIRTTGTPAAWCWFLIALAASLGANVATAGLLDLNDVPDWLRILVAGWPALAFLGGTLLVHAPPPAVNTVTTSSVDRKTAVTDQGEPSDLSAEPAPELTTAAAPAQPSPADTPPVPSALVEHARKVAEDHRARTGTPIDTPTLRARLGVPGPLADAIAARLT